MSNALGTINPVKEMIQLARERGVVTVLDGAQAVAHMPVDVVDLGCDFYAFSAHKLFGPTGVGVLWGRGELLETLPLYAGEKLICQIRNLYSFLVFSPVGISV